MKIGGLSFWSRIVFSLTLYGNTKERAVGHGVSHEKFFALGTFAVLGINVPSRYYGRYGSALASVSLRVYFKFNRRLALFWSGDSQIRHQYNGGQIYLPDSNLWHLGGCNSEAFPDCMAHLNSPLHGTEMTLWQPIRIPLKHISSCHLLYVPQVIDIVVDPAVLPQLSIGRFSDPARPTQPRTDRIWILLTIITKPRHRGSSSQIGFKDNR